MERCAPLFEAMGQATFPAGYAQRIAATQFEPVAFALPLGHMRLPLA